MSLYKILKNKFPNVDIGTYHSDMYIEALPKVKKYLKENYKFWCNVRKFWSDNFKKYYFDIPFGNAKEDFEKQHSKYLKKQNNRYLKNGEKNMINESEKLYAASEKSWEEVCNDVKNRNLPVSIRQDYSGLPICTNCRAAVDPAPAILYGVDEIFCGRCKTTFAAFTVYTPEQLVIIKTILNDKIPLADRDLEFQTKGAISNPTDADKIKLQLPDKIKDIVNIAEEVKEVDREAKKRNR